jgi:hypothetical protein
MFEIHLIIIIIIIIIIFTSNHNFNGSRYDQHERIIDHN